MRRLVLLLLLPLIIILVLSGRSRGGQIGNSSIAGTRLHTDITASQLQTMLTSKDFTFVNVHIPYAGDITQTDLSIPYDEIDRNLDKLPADKNAKIVLYDRSGRMSTRAAQVLVQHGYTNVYQLAGGTVGWEKAGYPLLMNSNSPRGLQ